MADTVDMKVVVKHLVDGTFGENLCRICLLPLETTCENIFTQICKEDQEYCIAEVLEQVCDLMFSDTDNFSVCCDCFLMASTAYKLYITAKRSDEILNFYIEELEKNVYSIEIPEDTPSDTLCITLPEYVPSMNNFDYDIEGCLIDEYLLNHESTYSENQNSFPKYIKKEPELKIEYQKSFTKNTKREEPKIKIESVSKNRKLLKLNSETKDDELVVVIDEHGRRSYFKVLEDGTLESVTKRNVMVPNSKGFQEKQQTDVQQKSRKKRDPMIYTKCNYCSVKYRFLAKLKKHMKAEHGVELLICKVCKAITEDPIEHENHLAGHTGIHCCDYCNTIFKKRETIIAHLQWHEDKNIQNTDSAHVCELCGLILMDEEQLKDHYDKKHDKKFTCFYCGKMYKGEMSCESHIRKHELHMMAEAKRIKSEPPAKEPQRKPTAKKRVTCDTCGKNFVDERSLMWHSMLHTNERPYTCDTCGRGFISVNRRNQHAVCAHTMPTKRCPLCPALFHLRSMVNSHIKKVHLKAHKRRNRSSKHSSHIHWRTEPVPIQELGVDIQGHIIELRTKIDQQENLKELHMDAEFMIQGTRNE